MNIPHIPWLAWARLDSNNPKRYICGYCGTETGTTHGYNASGVIHRIYICTHCGLPTLFYSDQQVPGSDEAVQFHDLPDDIQKVYQEIASSIQNGNNTAAVLLSRKLLMHIAVEQGAEEGKQFAHYVTYLTEKGFVPPNANKLLEFIRQIGNQKNHEIVLASAIEAKKTLKFIESILQFAYELPAQFEDGES